MVGVGASPMGRIVARRAADLVAEALTDTRVVVLTGARQSGKSTLVRLLTRDRAAEWRNLDSVATREAATADPTGFVDTAELMVIDEIQRAPELLLAIKEQVDHDQRPGQYLLTGSARPLGLRALPDTLAGRTETIELWPLSQGEIDSHPDGFIDAVFDGDFSPSQSTTTRSDYAERVVRGGFPEAIARTRPERRARFFDSYVTDLITRDVSQLSEIERPTEMRALLRLLAGRMGHLLVVNALSNELRLSASSVHRYLGLVEEVFLIKRIPAWSRRISQRAVGTPKLCFVDSGIAANLLDVNTRGLLRPDSPFGPLLESFVLMELARQATWSQRRIELSHYRTKDGMEVDAVLEDRTGRVVGIEVKASATVRAEDFRGLRHFAERLGDDLLTGMVLYTGHEALSFGPRMRAVPISSLWETTRSGHPMTGSAATSRPGPPPG